MPAAASGSGLLRVAHLSPDSPAVDVAVAPLPDGTTTTDPGPDVATGLGYGSVGSYTALTPGSYAVSVRAAGAGPATPPALTARVEVPAGGGRTVAVTGPFADLSLRVLPDDLTAPPDGSARVRVLAGAAGAGALDVALASGPVLATALPFPGASDPVVVPAGPQTLLLGGTPTAGVPVDLASGAVVSVVVLDRPEGGLTARIVVDAAAPSRVPVGAVEAGGGGGLPPAVGTAVALALLGAAGCRRGRVLLTATTLGTAMTGLVPGTPPPEAAAERGVAEFLPAPPPAAVPTYLDLPSAGIATTLPAIDLDGSGALMPPVDPAVAGWYSGSAVPGDTGPAVLAGHVDWSGRPGVFARLDEVAVGDPVLVGRADGSTQRFTVTRVARYAKAAFPTAEVYGATPDAQLRLITCGGRFDPRARSYLDNVVVFAAPAG